MIHYKTRTLLFVLLLATGFSNLNAADWSRFRGPNGNGVAPDDAPAPVKWSDDQNLKWKLELPGPGHSCPIVVGDRVFVTCWSGYGTGDDSDDQANLKRHLVCVDRNSGKILWDKSVPAVLPEDRYGGMFAEHGYATHTPVSDGERVFVFFGKTGVFAYDLEGNQLWERNVGTELNGRRWGSSSSPILYKNMLITPAAIESKSLIALDKTTGEEVWKNEAGGFDSTWGTPTVVQVDDERTDLVLAVPYEVWGFNPETGKLRWYCEAIGSNSMCSSVVSLDGIVYAMESGSNGGGSVAIKVGGKGDITETNIVWEGTDRNRIGTPVLHEDRLYWVSERIVRYINAKTGQKIDQFRLDGGSTSASANQGGGGRQGGGRRGGGRGRDYSSPVIANGKLYYVCRNGDMFVVQLGDELKQISHNRFENDNGEFSSTPAVSNGQLFIRSTKNLYCVANK